jgi:hypothetical protein
MILTLAVATVVLYVDNKRTKDCLSGYIVADNEATQARVRASDAEREAFKTTLRNLVDPKGTPLTRSAAIKNYIDLLDRNDQIRAKNPVRPVPTECD